jgi:hypothetical protein
MCDPNDNTDARLDRNLRMIGRHLRLPGVPEAEQCQPLARPPRSVRVSSFQRGVLFMKNHRYLTLAGAGSAAAALLAIWVMLFMPTPQSTVQAAAIFESFREAVGNAFEISFENLGDEGVRADGRVVVVFDADEGETAPFEGHAKAVYVEATAVAGDDAEDDVAGLDVEVAVAVVPGDEWVYLKLNGLPTEVVEEEPMAVWVQTIAQDGILLDLDGILEHGEFGDILAEASLKNHFSDAACDGKPAKIEITDVRVNGEDIDIDEEELARLAVNVFTGRATAQEFESLVSLIEQAATDVSVTETERGLHVLTATGFNFEDDEEAQQFLGQMELQIAYREGVGLAWAKLEHVGPYDGNIRFQMTDLTVDDELFNRERYLADGKTRRFDLGSLIETFGLMEE